MPGCNGTKVGVLLMSIRQTILTCIILCCFESYKLFFYRPLFYLLREIEDLVDHEDGMAQEEIEYVTLVFQVSLT